MDEDKPRYYILNAYTYEYLGESKYLYNKNSSEAWLLTTNWGSQPDKAAEKFKWVLDTSDPPALDMRVINVATGRALQETEDTFNDAGDNTVTAMELGSSGLRCKWFLRNESDGSYSIRNVYTGHVLGASKKECNARGDHHVMCSQDGKTDPSLSKWRWYVLSCDASQST